MQTLLCFSSCLPDFSTLPSSPPTSLPCVSEYSTWQSLPCLVVCHLSAAHLSHKQTFAFNDRQMQFYLITISLSFNWMIFCINQWKDWNFFLTFFFTNADVTLALSTYIHLHFLIVIRSGRSSNLTAGRLLIFKSCLSDCPPLVSSLFIRPDLVHQILQNLFSATFSILFTLIIFSSVNLNFCSSSLCFNHH